MAYGIQLFDDTGSLMWDSSTTGGGVIADSVVVPANTTVSRAYPQFPGTTLEIIAMTILGYLYDDNNPAIIDYSQGYPSITFPVNITTLTFTLVVR